MRLYRRLANLVRRDQVTREIEREMAFHVAELEDELRAAGLPESEARREARRRFGSVAVQGERTREVDLLTWLESVGADLRYALRALRANVAFAVAAVLSLGLGIGANAGIFGLVDAVLLRPLPVSRPGELMALTMGGRGGDEFNNPLWEAVRDRQTVFSGMLAYAGERFELAEGGASRPVQGAWVSGGYFGTLGVRPAAGRLLQSSDDVRGCPPVAVIGHAFWQGAYGGDPSIVGRTLRLGGHSIEVLGVVEAGFSGAEVGRAEQIFLPLCAKATMADGDGGLSEPGYWFLHIMGRRRPGVSEAEASSRMAALAPVVFRATVPDWNETMRRHYLENALTAEPAGKGHSTLRTSYGLALLALMGVVGLVLLIACGNVANLLLVRATVRRREMAVRVALGAGRGRLARQLMTESLVLAAFGAAVGLVFGLWSSRVVVRLLSSGAAGAGAPIWLDLSPDVRLLGFTVAVAALTGLVFGLVPAWQVSRLDPQRTLSGHGRSTAPGPRLRAGRGLVVGQLALSMVLVVTAGLLLGTFRKLRNLELGFRPQGVMLLSVKPEAASPAARQVLQRQILERLRILPGVRSASASALTPISGAAWNAPVEVAGYTPTSRRDRSVWVNAISAGYFSTMGTRLLSGRDFGPEDREGSAPVAIISESLARHYFRGADPLGRHIRITEPDPQDLQVVGVVEDAMYRSLREAMAPTLYLAMDQTPDAPFNFELRSGGPAAAVIRPVAAMLRRSAPGAVFQFRSLSDQVAASLLRERLLATLSGFFGALALLLAAIGLYGTVAYSVARRRNEIGIRVALGAAAGKVVRMILGDVARLVVFGVLIGAILTLAATRFLASLLYGVEPSDPGVLVLSALALSAVALLAGAIPAARAAASDPVAALRAE